MTTYTVDVNGVTSPMAPAFPQGVINDSLQPDGSFDQTTTTATVYIGDFSQPQQSFQLQSLYVGSAIEVDVGVFSSVTITGTGSVTGSNDTTKILPAFVNYGILDINGSINIAFTSYNKVIVSAGERLDLEGDYSGTSAATTTVAAGAELDLNSQNSAAVSALSSSGTLKVTAPSARFIGATTLGGSVLVQGDALNGIGSGTAAARSTGNANGAYVAALDLRGATFAAPIVNLTLAQDAQISFGSGTTTVARFAVAGSATALRPLDLVNVEGTLRITGDGSGVANQVSISQAEFAGIAAAAGAGNDTIDFVVAASDGGASLQQRIVVDANTTLRNGAAMFIGGQGTATTTIGATSAAAGSTFVNGAGARLTIAGGASLSVGAIQNAGTVDVTSGTLALEVAVQGAGSIAVENGATLSIDAAITQGSVALRSGSLLRLSQPSSFASTIQAPAAGARIDLAGLTATSAKVANGSIVIATPNGSLTLAETGLVDGATLALASDGAGGSLITLSAASVAAAPHPAVYRFFDAVHGTQFLTSSASETQMLQATRTDLVYEGVGLASVDPASDATAAPVYRFFDSIFGTHFYTSSATERNTVLATRSDLVDEGIGFYEHTTQQPGDNAVFRFFDSNAGTHFYTASPGERATIIATRPDLVSEGVGFYAPST